MSATSWHDVQRTRYDVVVAGGGLAGIAAAHRSAQQGMRVVVVEPTGTLGREVVRGRCMFVSEKMLRATDVGRLSLERLRSGAAWFDGALDTNFAALVYDEILDDAGVDVLFHCWPVGAMRRNGQVDGLRFAGRGGYSSVSAPRIIDASRGGRIAGALNRYAQPTTRLVSHRFLFQRALPADSGAADAVAVSPSGTAATWLHGEDGDGNPWEIEVRPTYWPGEVRVAVETCQPASRSLVAPTLVQLETLRRGVDLLDGTRLVHIAEEALEVPTLDGVPGQDPGDVVIWAGVPVEGDVRPRDDEVFALLLERGQSAAALALR